MHIKRRVIVRIKINWDLFCVVPIVERAGEKEKEKKRKSRIRKREKKIKELRATGRTRHSFIFLFFTTLRVCRRKGERER